MARPRAVWSPIAATRGPEGDAATRTEACGRGSSPRRETAVTVRPGRETLSATSTMVSPVPTSMTSPSARATASRAPGRQGSGTKRSEASSPGGAQSRPGASMPTASTTASATRRRRCRGRGDIGACRGRRVGQARGPGRGRWRRRSRPRRRRCPRPRRPAPPGGRSAAPVGEEVVGAGAGVDRAAGPLREVLGVVEVAGQVTRAHVEQVAGVRGREGDPTPHTGAVGSRVDDGDPHRTTERAQLPDETQGGEGPTRTGPDDDDVRRAAVRRRRPRWVHHEVLNS